MKDKDGNIDDVVLCYDDIIHNGRTGTYFGALVGRIANRIKRGKFTLNDKESIKILKIQKLEDKILYILNTNKGVYRFKNISQFSISLGVSREALSREISKMCLEYKIRRVKNTLHLLK